MEQESSIEDALERGARRLTRWTQDGTLIAPQLLAKAWAQDLQTLQAAVQRGDVFEVWVDNAPYFAAVFTAMGNDATAKVCRALGVGICAGRGGEPRNLNTYRDRQHQKIDAWAVDPRRGQPIFAHSLRE